MRPEAICPVCKTTFLSQPCRVKRSKIHCCSHKCSDVIRRTIKGEQHPLYKEEKKKYFCIDCGTEVCQNDILRCRSCAKKGELNPGYLDGHGCDAYPQEFTESLKEEVRDRDNHICQNPDCCCTEEENGRALSIHHIDYDRTNCVKENLISLCLSCHIKTNINREHWKMLFKNLIENMYCLVGKRG